MAENPSRLHMPRWDWLSVRKNLLALGALTLVLLSARSVLADHYHVPTGSMEPTVSVGDRIFVNKAAYGLRVPFSNAYVVEFEGPQPGDVVVLESPEDGEVLLKRVVASPGDRIAVFAGRLELNGEVVPIDQRPDGLYEHLGRTPHPVRLTHGGGPDLAETVIPEDRFLVMGDNRGNSLDGRVFGLVERGAILGRAVSVFVRDGEITWNSI